MKPSYIEAIDSGAIIFGTVYLLTKGDIVLSTRFIIHRKKDYGSKFLFVPVISCPLASLCHMFDYMLFIFQDGRINYDEFVVMMRKNNQEMAQDKLLRKQFL